MHSEPPETPDLPGPDAGIAAAPRGWRLAAARLKRLRLRYVNDRTTAGLTSFLFHFVGLIILALTWSSVAREDLAKARPDWVVEFDDSQSGGQNATLGLDSPWADNGSAEPATRDASSGASAAASAGARSASVPARAGPAAATSAGREASSTGGQVPNITVEPPPFAGSDSGAQAVGGGASTARAASAADAVLPDVNWLASSGSPTGGGLEGRQGSLKEMLLRTRGGTPQSEEAVQKGLRWLAAHQKPDGCWRFDLDGPCQGRCRNAGDYASINASTALALLPFYGAGQTHHQGDYVDTVRRGLVFLGTHMRVTPDGADFQQGSMYSQGLTTMVLCEAYAMSGDENLRPYCEEALKFIVYAQHPQGGWRYLPGQAGDITSTGWQLMALKCGLLANLPVGLAAMRRANDFLDRVESDDRAGYVYQPGDKQGRCTTAIGLYCRMLTGAPREEPDVQRGAALLEKWGLSPNDMYFNYYATMVLDHLDRPTWSAWNQSLRERLIKDQATEGHEAGSWYYDHRYSRQGGRLYVTSLCLLTLEVYYRYLPLYNPPPSTDGR